MKELPKVYDPRDVESRIYQMWMDGGCFKAEPDPNKKPFSIVMPPPNVTGQLHMGHATGLHAAGHPDPLQADAGLRTPCGSPARTTPASPPRSRWRRNCAPRRA